MTTTLRAFRGQAGGGDRRRRASSAPPSAARSPPRAPRSPGSTSRRRRGAAAPRRRRRARARRRHRRARRWAALAGADLVVHTAAYVHEWGDDGGVRPRQRRRHRDGARRGRGAPAPSASSTSARSSSTATTTRPSRTSTALRRTYGIPYIDTKSASDRARAPPRRRRGPPWRRLRAGLDPVDRPPARAGPRGTARRSRRRATGAMLPVYVDDLVEAILLRRARAGRARRGLRGLGRRAGQLSATTSPGSPRSPAAVRRAACRARCSSWPGRRWSAGPALRGRPAGRSPRARDLRRPAGDGLDRATALRARLGAAGPLDEGLRRCAEWARAQGLIDAGMPATLRARRVGAPSRIRMVAALSRRKILLAALWRLLALALALRRPAPARCSSAPPDAALAERRDDMHRLLGDDRHRHRDRRPRQRGAGRGGDALPRPPRPRPGALTAGRGALRPLIGGARGPRPGDLHLRHRRHQLGATSSPRPRRARRRPTAQVGVKGWRSSRPTRRGGVATGEEAERGASPPRRARSRSRRSASSGCGASSTRAQRRRRALLLRRAGRPGRHRRLLNLTSTDVIHAGGSRRWPDRSRPCPERSRRPGSRPTRPALRGPLALLWDHATRRCAPGPRRQPRPSTRPTSRAERADARRGAGHRLERQHRRGRGGGGANEPADGTRTARPEVVTRERRRRRARTGSSARPAPTTRRSG